MKNPSELKAIVDHMDADPKTTSEYGKLGDLWFLDRMKKVEGSVSGLVSKIGSEDFNVQSLDWDRMEQIYNPYISGVNLIDDQMSKLVAKGMSVDLAETLARDYLNSVAQRSNTFTLMDLYSSNKAKRALHHPDTDMDQICFNFQSRMPRIASSFDQRLTQRAINSTQRIAPIRPVSYAMARTFSTSNIDTDDSDAEEQQKGRFFKFLEKAENLDKKLEENPEIA